MSPEEIEAIKKRLAKLSPGPWTADMGDALPFRNSCPLYIAPYTHGIDCEGSDCGFPMGVYDTLLDANGNQIATFFDPDKSDPATPNTEFVANAKTDVERLLNYVEKLQAELAQLKTKNGFST